MIMGGLIWVLLGFCLGIGVYPVIYDYFYNAIYDKPTETDDCGDSGFISSESDKGGNND